jgi:hypothetical protein
LIVGICTGEADREERLKKRNPEMFSEKPKEISIRMNDLSEYTYGFSHLIYNNT